MPGYYPATSKWLDEQFTNWLYGTEEGKKFMYNFSGYPIIGDYMQAKDSERWINDYFKNRHISWKDVKYPTMIKGTGNGGRSFRSFWSPTEKALKKLYY